MLEFDVRPGRYAVVGTVWMGRLVPASRVPPHVLLPEIAMRQLKT